MLGIFQEHGPYVMEDGTTNFVKNKYSWNKEASVFYLESPADVGYSLCPDPKECKWTDENSADDNLVAVLNLLQKFPEVMNNELYIAGESYAGIYVPKLTQRLDKYLTDNAKTGKYLPNLKGFMVGNGVTNWKYDTLPAFIQMGYWHGLYDDDLYNVIKGCDYTYYQFEPTKITGDCKTALDRFMELTAKINGYDVFGKCYTSSMQMYMYGTNNDNGFLQVGSEKKEPTKFFTARDYTPWA